MLPRSTLLTLLAAAGAAACLIAHLTALLLTGADPVSSPISQLSRGNLAPVHSAGLVALGLSWISIAILGWPQQTGRWWKSGLALLGASAALLPAIAIYFASASDERLFGPDANDPLAVLASLLGLAMGALQPGLRRRSTTTGWLNLLILGAWIALIPVIPFISPNTLGAYERTVGAIMLAWTALLIDATRRSPDS